MVWVFPLAMIILKDVIQRFRIQKQDILIRLAKFYITSIGSKITFNSVSKFLKLPVKTAYNFSLYLEKSYLIFFVDRFSFSIKAQNNSPRKVYTTDNSFPAVLGINPVEIKGRLLLSRNSWIREGRVVFEPYGWLFLDGQT